MNLEQAFCHELVDERKQIGLQRLTGRVEFVLHCFPHRAQRSVCCAKLPDPGADLVEAEVRAARKVEDDRFALQLAKHHVGRNPHGLFEGDAHTGSFSCMCLEIDGKNSITTFRQPDWYSE